MHLDFLEIGTSNFDTLLQTCDDTQIGMSVEPLKFYLDDLPDRPLVRKVHAAITHNKSSDSIRIFYIPPSVIDQYGLPQWFKGCNKIGDYHPLHKYHHVEHYVKIEDVPLLNVDEFFKLHSIESIKFLKIDTEGHDTVILRGLFEYLQTVGTETYPLKIQFESNENTKATDVDDIIFLFTSLGYKLAFRGYDTLLEYKSGNNVHSF